MREAHLELSDLAFSGAGLTLITGPNGSGKSSVARAIESHPVEKIGRTLRGYMTAMKQISVGG